MTGAVDMFDRRYLVRGIRWQAICGVAGTFGRRAAIARRRNRRNILVGTGMFTTERTAHNVTRTQKDDRDELTHDAMMESTFYHSLARRVRLRTRLYWAGQWANQRYTSAASPIIIGGAVRSGTTLLRTILDSHPSIAAGPESWLFVYRIDRASLAADYGFALDEIQAIRRSTRGLAEFADRFFTEYASRMGKRRWAEKSPSNVTRLKYIWKHFPKAKFVHMIRDGRDVVCSIRSQRERLFAQGLARAPGPPLKDRILLWKSHVEAGLRWRGDPRYIEVKYEDLVNSPRETIARVLDFVDEPFCEEVLRAHELQQRRQQPIVEYGTPEVHRPIFRESVGRWKRDLSSDEIGFFLKTAGPLLERLGYSG